MKPVEITPDDDLNCPMQPAGSGLASMDNFVSGAQWGLNFFGSNYIGNINPKADGEYVYYVRPQDAADGAARLHDMAYDESDISGFSGAKSMEAMDADIELIRTTSKIMYMYQFRETDPFTNMPISKETYERAQYMNFAFMSLVASRLNDSDLSNEEKDAIFQRIGQFSDLDINEATGRNDFR